MTERERQYDEIVAPMLRDVSARCAALGFDLVARVEWEPGEAGITLMGENASSGQMLTRYAALSRGNVDAMLLQLIRNVDVSQSMFLHRYGPAASGSER